MSGVREVDPAASSVALPSPDTAPRARLRLPGDLATGRLSNGMRLCVFENRRAPVVSTALTFLVGAADESPEEAGLAHFLEHMMFKGARRYGPGAIDRVTQSLGGRSNAYTSHDATVYTFGFQADRWPVALDIEADRLGGPTLDPDELERERGVVIEEIAMYENEPWDALEQAVHEALYGDHPYARSILGRREDLERHTPEAMAAFFRRHYTPRNACLVVAGDVDWDAAVEAARALGAIEGAEAPERRWPAFAKPKGVERVERRRGDIARLFVAMPGPTAVEEAHAACAQLALVLAGGRASRLHRDLVEERRLCLWVSADEGESLGPGAFTVALEVTPGVSHRLVESEVLRAFDRLVEAPPDDEEISRARRIAHADWVFAHERTAQQSLAIARDAVLGAGFTERSIERQLEIDRAALVEAAALIHPDNGAVVGWSLPE